MIVDPPIQLKNYNKIALKLNQYDSVFKVTLQLPDGSMCCDNFLDYITEFLSSDTTGLTYVLAIRNINAGELKVVLLPLIESA
jgi:hypothetical protein